MEGYVMKENPKEGAEQFQANLRIYKAVRGVPKLPETGDARAEESETGET